MSVISGGRRDRQIWSRAANKALISLAVFSLNEADSDIDSR